MPVAKRLGRRVLDRLTGVLVDDPKHRVERLAERRPAAVQPVSDSATAFRYVMRPVDVGGDDGVADAAQRDPQQFAPLARPHLGEARRLAEPDDERNR